MSAYLVAFVDVRDQERFTKEYVPPIAATLRPFGGRVLAASEEEVSLEGRLPPGRTVIIEFPDLDRARKWYSSDAYGPLLQLRKSIATAVLAILPGIPASHT